MTLTAPGWGMGQIIADEAKRLNEEVPGVTEADVLVVFDPPWNQQMMSEAAKLQLGFDSEREVVRAQQVGGRQAQRSPHGAVAASLFGAGSGAMVFPKDPP